MSPAERPAPPPPPASGTAGGAAETRVEPAADPDLPGFARVRPPGPLWRIPFVYFFLFATGGLLLLHYV